MVFSERGRRMMCFKKKEIGKPKKQKRKRKRNIYVTNGFKKKNCL
jgi:hypothetical protein